jgi:hypothetical protein
MYGAELLTHHERVQVRILLTFWGRYIMMKLVSVTFFYENLVVIKVE